MKLYYVGQEVLEDLKNNIASNIENYKEDSNQWILDRYDKPFFEYKREAHDFQLLVNPDDVGSSDIENVKILHSKLKFLTKNEAADERLWVGLTHSIFWEFMQERWKTNSVKEARQVGNRYFLTGASSNRRVLLMNTLSRYWWIGELIYDIENKKDPYHLIEVFRGDFTTNVHTFLSSNFTSNPKIVKGVLKPILRYKNEKGAISRGEIQAIIRHANLIGGSYLLDYLSEEEIENKIEFFIDNTFRENIKDENIIKEAINLDSQEENKKGIFSKLKESLLGG